MGYTPPRKSYTLQFEQEEMAGLEVITNPVSTGTFLTITEMADAKSADVGEMKTLMSSFAKVLRSWNLEFEGGEPVPTTLEGLMTQEFSFVMDIVLAWMDAVAGTPAPLEKKSSAGGQSQELLLPMGPSSASLAS